MPAPFHPLPRLSRMIACLAAGAVVWLAGCGKQHSRPSSGWTAAPAFWVWNRHLDDGADGLRGGQHELRWLAIEFPAGAGREPLRWVTRSQLQACRLAVPVFRLPAGTRLLDDEPYRLAVMRELRAWSGGSPLARLEIDYDCPSRRLDDYAAWLGRLRGELGVEQLEVTALAAWIEAPEFRALARSVDGLTPMFYDLEADEDRQVRRGSFHRLVDARTLDWIRAWRACPVPWRAGLPNYRRLSLYRADGSLVGHLRRWQHGSWAGHSRLERQPGADADLEVCRALADTRLGGTEVRRGDWLVLRQPAQAMLAEAIAAARRAGASGIVWFDHPDSGPPAAYSVPHLAALQSSARPQARLVQRILADGSIELANEGNGDVLPLADGSWHECVVRAARGIRFAQPGAGSFDEVRIPLDSVLEPGLVAEIRLRYHRLPAGGVLRSRPGTVQKPGDGRSPSSTVVPRP